MGCVLILVLLCKYAKLFLVFLFGKTELCRTQGGDALMSSGGFEKSQLKATGREGKDRTVYLCVFARLLGGGGASCRLLGEEGGLDVGQHTTLSDGHSGQKLVQLFVIPDGQLKVAGVDPLLLVVAGRVSRQFQDLGGKVLHHRG